MAANIDHLNILQQAQLVWNLLRDERVSPWLKRLGPAALLAYVVSPVDIIPDVFLGVGQMDDLGVVTVGVLLLARLLVRFAPDEIVHEYLDRMQGRGPRAQSREETEDSRAHEDSIETPYSVR